MRKLLFSEFPPVPKDRWREQAEKELRGKNFAETLRWNPEEGISLDPYFTPEDLAVVPVAAIQAAQKAAPGWENRVLVFGRNEEEVNRLAREAIAGGADAVQMDLLSPSFSLPKLLNGIKLSDTPVTFGLHQQPPDAFLRNLRAATGYPPKGSFSGTAFPALGEKGPDALSALAESLRLTEDAPGFRPLGIWEPAYPPGSAVAVGSLALLLLQVVNVLDRLTDEGFSPAAVFAKLEVDLSADADFYRSLTKVRALRFLVANLQRAYGVEPPVPVHVHTRAYALSPVGGKPEAENLIRATLRAMSVLAAGCDSLTVVAAASEQPAASRWSRNVANLLKEEARFARVADPAAGSYFLETLTWELAQAAWATFLGHG